MDEAGVVELERRLDRLRIRPGPHPPDEHLGLIVAEEAVTAAATDNYGVGAVLAAPDGAVVERGQWQRLRERQRIEPAQVSHELRAFALDCFELNLDRQRERIVADPPA